VNVVVAQATMFDSSNATLNRVSDHESWSEAFVDRTAELAPTATRLCELQ
jgi:hypothetical protein